jgi:hypothetical protein
VIPAPEKGNVQCVTPKIQYTYIANQRLLGREEVRTKLLQAYKHPQDCHMPFSCHAEWHQNIQGCQVFGCLEECHYAVIDYCTIMIYVVCSLYWLLCLRFHGCATGGYLFFL